MHAKGKFEYLDDTWVFDIQLLTWHKMTCTGDIPAGRYGHSAHIVGSRMFIFGGKGKHGLLNDVMFLDLLQWAWVPVNTLSQGPCARMFQATELVGRKVVVHGGWDGEEVFSDLWIFNTESFSWAQPRAAGFAPSARFGHTLSLCADGRLLIFGGCSLNKDTGIPRYNSDIMQLDTDTMVWTRPRVNGESPSGRYGHTAVVMQDAKLVVFGGWGKLGCQSPEATSNPNVHAMHTLDTRDMTWSVCQNTSKKPLKQLYNHSACFAENSMYIFGGYDGRQASNDFFSFFMEI